VVQLEQDGDFRGLVQALEDASADDVTKGNTAMALARLMRVDADKADIVAAGAIPPL
jgi:hypothetical protein